MKSWLLAEGLSLRDIVIIIEIEQIKPKYGIVYSDMMEHRKDRK